MYRKGTVYENLTKANFIGEGMYNIPSIEPTNIKPGKYIGFNYAMTADTQDDTCVHFFIDDYQFERIWNHTVEEMKRRKINEI